jgi:hypothetical protein
MFDRLGQFFLCHPAFVDPERTPACYISHRPFELHHFINVGFLGHPDVIEIDVPLIDRPGAIIVQPDQSVLFSVSFLRFCFYTNVFRSADKNFLETAMIQRRIKELEQISEQMPGVHKSRLLS